MADHGSEGAGPEMQPAAELLPVVYAELRRLAAALAGRLPPGPDPPADRPGPRGVSAAGGRPGPRLEWPPPLLRRRRAGDAGHPRRTGPAQGARKHGGGGHRVELTEGLAVIEPPADDLLAVDEAIQALRAEKPHLAEIAMLRYFAGLSVDETAAVLGISASTLAREWRFVRAWLARRLGDAPVRAGGGDE